MTLNLVPPDYPRTIAAQLARREDRDRMVEFSAEALYQLGRVCPFAGLVYYYPELERITVTAGGHGLASISAEEVRRIGNTGHAAAILGARARDAYAALEPLPHDHPLGQD